MHFQSTDSKIKLANSSTTEVKARGDVGLTAYHEKVNKPVNPENAFVPELRTNLMSLMKIVDNNHEVIFKKTRAIIQDTQRNVIAKRRNLFYLSTSRQEVNAAANIRSNEDVAQTLWPCKLWGPESDEERSDRHRYRF